MTKRYRCRYGKGLTLRTLLADLQQIADKWPDTLDSVVEIEVHTSRIMTRLLKASGAGYRNFNGRNPLAVLHADMRDDLVEPEGGAR